ncbi:MAG TPA: amidase family protein, partial [Polyangiaceae bacterium]|nr:amidase family protein [Polyangiaceae bacterium]
GPDLGDVMGGLVCEHAVTVSVRDSALLLDLTQGPAAGDPYFAAPPVRPYMEEVRTPPGKLRIAVSTKTLNGVEVHPDCLAAVADAKQLCSELGHEVFDAELPISGDMFAHAFSVLWTTGAALTLDGTAMLTGLTPTKDNIEPLSYALAEAGRAHSASSYLLAVGLLQRLCREIGRFMKGHAVLLPPLLADPPVPLGSFHQPSEDPLQGLVRAAQFAPFTPIQNATGEPAMSVPLYWNAEGLPIGVQFAGRYGDEATLFRLAAQLETARPWAKKKPKVSA